jgi:hypothetical protein
VKHRREKEGSRERRIRRTEGKPVIHKRRILIAENFILKSSTHRK